MRMVLFALVIFSSILLISCFSDDDGGGGYNDYIYLAVEDAMAIDVKENYKVGDTIFFELNFSRYLPEEGYTTLLDIYKSTDANEFSYDFGLRKFSSFANEYQHVAIDSIFVHVLKGRLSDYSYNPQPLAVLNTEEEIYESRVALILAEAGQFQIDFNSNIRGPYNEGKVIIEIQNRFSNPEDAVQEFTVME